ncbi:MAG TPA: APC family permease [Blastocatellia bacterium]|nr:APC family permease [Blastocatellia bacterium]
MKVETDRAAQTMEKRRGRLLQVLGVGFGVAVIIGNTIGAGILRTPGEVAAHLPDGRLFISVWIAGGLYALLGAISMAELGTMIPQSGGQYVFARRALGDYAGFIVGWSDWISTCGTVAAVAIVVGEYTSVLVPALAGRTAGIALAVTVVFALLQWRGISWGSGVQNLTSLLKALAFIALIAACFALGGNHSNIASPQPPIPIEQSFFVSIILSLQAVIYTYDGWTGVIYFSEEVREPDRDIPRAMLGGVVSVIVIYLLVNLAFLYVLPIPMLAGEQLAAGAAARAIFGERGDTVIRVLMIVSMMSSINANHLMASRVLFGMSRDGLFSRRAVGVNKGGTPTAALLIGTLVAVIFILLGKTFDQVTAVVAFFFAANYAISFWSVFVLRRQEPDAPRPYRVWGYPWTTALALTASIAFLAGAIASDVAGGTLVSIYALILLAASYPAFRLMKWVVSVELPRA